MKNTNIDFPRCSCVFREVEEIFFAFFLERDSISRLLPYRTFHLIGETDTRVPPCIIARRNYHRSKFLRGFSSFILLSLRAVPEYIFCIQINDVLSLRNAPINNSNHVFLNRALKTNLDRFRSLFSDGPLTRVNVAALFVRTRRKSSELDASNEHPGRIVPS